MHFIFNSKTITPCQQWSSIYQIILTYKLTKIYSPIRNYNLANSKCKSRPNFLIMVAEILLKFYSTNAGRRKKLVPCKNKKERTKDIEIKIKKMIVYIIYFLFIFHSIRNPENINNSSNIESLQYCLFFIS